MKVSNLRKQEAALLSSNNKRFNLYGQAYKEILRQYDQYAKSWLSDEQLLSTIAKLYISKQQKEMQFTKNKEEYNIRISAAIKLIVNDKMDYNTLYLIVKNLNLNIKDLTFENVRNKLLNKYFYSLITPENLKKVVSDLQKDFAYNRN